MAEDKQPFVNYLEGVDEALLNLKLTDDHEKACLVYEKANKYITGDDDVPTTSVKDVLEEIWKDGTDIGLLKELCAELKKSDDVSRKVHIANPGTPPTLSDQPRFQTEHGPKHNGQNMESEFPTERAALLGGDQSTLKHTQPSPELPSKNGVPESNDGSDQGASEIVLWHPKILEATFVASDAGQEDRGKGGASMEWVKDELEKQAKETKKELEKQANETQRAIEKATNETKKEFEKKIEELKKQILDQAHSLQEKQAEIEQLKEEGKKKDDQIKLWKAKSEQLQEDSVQYQATMKSLLNEKMEIEAKLDEAKEMVKTLKSELQKEKDKVQQLEQQNKEKPSEEMQAVQGLILSLQAQIIESQQETRATVTREAQQTRRQSDQHAQQISEDIGGVQSLLQIGISTSTPPPSYSDENDGPSYVS